ncbi:MAG TPA: response regulator [Bacteroidia bacterium]|nr:response regulator [Bacteroidia bacterium]
MIMANGKVISILLIEDDEVDVMNLKRAFKKNNITNPLYLAGNGLEALELLRSCGTEEMPLPKIILLDLNMPKMNGIEFLRELRNDQRLHHISVFVMTTSNKDNDIIEAYNLNVAGYILKPLSMDKFMGAVAALSNYWQLCEFPS